MKNSGRLFNKRRIIFNAGSLLQHKSNFSMAKIWLEQRICVLFSYLTSLIALAARYFTCRTTKNIEKWPFCRKRPGKFIRSVDTIFLCPESDSALNFESEILRSEAILWNLDNFGNPNHGPLRNVKNHDFLEQILLVIPLIKTILKDESFGVRFAKIQSIP